LERWFEEQRAVIAANNDAIHLCSGEEGTWKSLWMRKCAAYLDPQFNVDHIHFTQEDFMDDVADLEPGRAVVLDEFDGHRRLAMHGSRMRFLRWVKNNREKSLHVWIGYPQAGTFEKDLLYSRIRYWEYKPNRPQVRIRRRTTREGFTLKAEPINITKFPVVGNYTLTGDNDPLRAAYTAKKKAHMRDTALDRDDDETTLDAYAEARNRLKDIIAPFPSHLRP